jgi:hypothetical protein
MRSTATIGAFDRRRALRLCQGSVLARRRDGARTQMREVLARRRAVLARRSVVLARRCVNDLEEAAVRSTERTAFDRTVDA